jgi:hypothetical protein
VTNFARMPARAAGHTRRLSILLLLALAGSCVFAASSEAVVAEVVAGTQVGVQPRTSSIVAPSGSFTNNSGNAVVDGASVYVVYWDPGAWFHPEWVRNVDTFVNQLGASSGEFGTIFAALGQYRDRANVPAGYHFVFKGSYSDTAPYPTGKCSDQEPLTVGQITCVTDAQVREQLQSFIAGKGTPKGMNAIYYMLTPPGVDVCLDEASTHCSDYTGAKGGTSYKNSFCSYHGAINPDNAVEGDGSTILYATIPWSAGYEGHPWDFVPGASMAGQAFDCQDGGFNPEKGEENLEVAKELNTAEQEAFAKMSLEEQEEFEEARALEASHIEEPNQEGRGEEGDDAPGLSDLLVNQIAEEQANIVTDPLLTSWHDPVSGREATDECRNVFSGTAAPSSIGGSVKAEKGTEAGTLSNESVAGGQYYINNVVNVGALHRSECVGGVGLVPRFTSPNPVNSSELVDFDGMESTVTEFKGAVFGPSGPPSTTYAKFAWNFGDGTSEVSGFAPGAPTCEAPWLSPCAASAFHSYTYGGTYDVTLTITDVAGNVAQVKHEVTVVGPAPPAPAGSPGSAAPGTTPGSSGSTGANGANGSGTPVVTPTAKAAVASHSLSTTLRKGLAVTYSVNEQVTGHFEVMIARSLAKKLKISGTPAKGLPAGTVPQLVIAKAVLVTTKGGHSTVHIQFSKKVAARLKHTHRAPLMLRLIVRNASSSNPQTATVLSSVILAG